jgi:hypothetical protein
MNAPATPAAAAAAAGGHSLDELIFVELAGRALQVSNGVLAVAGGDPSKLAALSMQLADAYREAHKARLAALGPKNVGYEIQMDDLMNWEKK